ncbi:glycosyltransferase [Mastigocladus laminosus UU774]|nr:glycosyltransferase [Mastigocladus laminosus UU774]
MPKIAIIIPNYNNSDTIIQTLDSIQNQKEYLSKIFVVYIADDCSKDNSVSLAEAAWKSFIPLHIYRGEENVGQWNNVNRAIDSLKETVDWVLILHSDDIAKPNWLKMMLLRIEGCSEKIGSICSSWDNLLPDGCVVLGEDNPTRQIEVIEGNDEAVRGALRTGCWWHISGCAIRVKTLEDCGGFNQKFPYQADWEWLLRCLKRGWGVEYIPRTLILYRQSSVSVSSKAFQTHQDIKEFLDIIPQYISFLESNDIFSLHLQRIKFTVRRMIKSLVTLNTQRFLQSFYILFMIVASFKACKK